MFVKNPKEFNCLKFSKRVQDYLIKHRVPVFAIEGGENLFKDSKILRDVLSKSPKWIKSSAKKEGLEFEKNKV